PPDFEISSGGAIAIPAPVAVARKTPSRLFWDRLKQDKAALVGGAIVIILILLGIFGGPLAAAISGHAQNQTFPERMSDPYGIPLAPNRDFWFGADASYRDLFVRTMYGARTSLFVGIVATALSMFIGIVVGLTAGFFGGAVDTVLSRFAD